MTTVTLVGTMQALLGCPSDWLPGCPATELVAGAGGAGGGGGGAGGGGTAYGASFLLPAGSYAFKVALDGSWAENYGAGGVPGGPNIPLVLAGDATVQFSYDPGSHLLTAAPTDLPGDATDADRALALDSLRAPLTRERFYFVMTDRFANGDPANDAGGLVGDRLVTGLDPTDTGFFHGGDLAGLTARLDYIQGLGTTALWLTPVLTNKPVQLTDGVPSAGYHGYWITDFTSVDPHLGSRDELAALVDAAHQRGLKVFFDIVVNHTADVIAYQGGGSAYVSRADRPYTDAGGTPFDDTAYAGSADFPELDPATSFPYVPLFPEPNDATAKTPAWLNDPAMYHNRGNSLFVGESTEHGDIVGLDDLFTERPEVVQGMVDIYLDWVDVGIDGYRIDTVKHVGVPFWETFCAAVLAHARAHGRPDFFLFGEVYDDRPSFESTYTTVGGLQGALDFGFQADALAFVAGGPATGLQELFAEDDYYIDTNSNAYELVTFLGNHDMGRLPMLLGTRGITDPADLLARTRLALALLFLVRGQPVVYYGDEQGFIGLGGDQAARQDMFATAVPQYATEPNLTDAGGSRDRFDPTSPLYLLISQLAALRAAHPALADGAQIHRYAAGSAGVYAFSRVGHDADGCPVEYVVAVNNSGSAATASFSTYTPGATFAPLLGSDASPVSDAGGQLNVDVPALSAAVWRAATAIPDRPGAPAVALALPQPGAALTGRTEILAAVAEDAFVQVTLAFRLAGDADWQVLGTDDSPPYRVFHDVSALPPGELVEYRAVVKDVSGNISAASGFGFVSEESGPATPDLSVARAFWVEADLLAWPARGLPAGPGALVWELVTSPDGTVEVVEGRVAGGTAHELTYDPAGLPAGLTGRHPELLGYLALRLGAPSAAHAGDLLRGQLVVSMSDGAGAVLDAAAVQTPVVLDALYAVSAGSAATRVLGATWSGVVPSLAVWAPTAQAVTLLLWPAGTAAAAGTAAPPGTADPERIIMDRQDDGCWTVTGEPGWADAAYLFEVVVFVPQNGRVETNLVTDPYCVALLPDSTRSVLVDLDRADLAPDLWLSTPSPPLTQPVDSTIYELHVRDYSIGDELVPAQHRGGYLAFADEGAGRAHLRALAAAGLNTVHLLPTHDFTSVPEDPADQQQPAGDLGALPPDSAEQQARIAAVASRDGFNWGYDPWHWLVPEGSYASSLQAATGGARVAEFRTMVGALHADGLRVVLDQVFNHTPVAGQAAASVLDRIVPGYYHRLDPSGAIYRATGSDDIATEHAMAGKLMVDAVVSWARHYRVDGFRFDLMGFHSVATMLAIRAGLDALTLAADGVDGASIYLYGEGWSFGEVAGDALFVQARQGNLGGTGIGTFSDRLRDAVRGGGSSDADPRAQGFGSGEATDPNGTPVTGGAASLAAHTDLLQLGLAGNLRSYAFRTSSGRVLRGDQITYNGSPAGYADQPDEVISYVDAHDNETLWDALTWKLPPATSMADRIRMNTLCLATTALAQTPSFWHAGADLLRSKSLDRNSYDSGDWFNRLDWTGADNGFGRGLPPAGDNQPRWPLMAPLLADPGLRPAAADVAAAALAARDLLRLRLSTPLFRLGTAQRILDKVGFPVSGTADALPGVVVMAIDDTVGQDVDPALARVVVVLNATPAAVVQHLPGMPGARLELSPVQAGSSDPVVRSAAWDPVATTLTVPARTVAVFVEPG